jgi:prepilin-type N-terminal cleavage/methylation domain-containing protein
MRIRRAKRQEGFTLIEVIASLAIIGLGLVGILSLFPVGIDASKRAGDLTNATILGQSVLSQIRAAARKGDMTLTNAKRIFQSSVPKNFSSAQNRGDRVVPIEDANVPKMDVLGKEATLYQYQVKFDDPPKADKLDDLGRSVGLQRVTVTVSWPADEQEIELRNKVELVTFVRFAD